MPPDEFLETDELERRLKTLAPRASDVSLGQIMYRAGYEAGIAVRPSCSILQRSLGSGWALASAALLLVSVGLSVWLMLRPERVVYRQVVIDPQQPTMSLPGPESAAPPPALESPEDSTTQQTLQPRLANENPRRYRSAPRSLASNSLAHRNLALSQGIDALPSLKATRTTPLRPATAGEWRRQMQRRSQRGLPFFLGD